MFTHEICQCRQLLYVFDHQVKRCSIHPLQGCAFHYIRLLRISVLSWWFSLLKQFHDTLLVLPEVVSEPEVYDAFDVFEFE